ncbi:hypothetical protein DFH27DRAFT_97632 [Peziza echinospora]|nr:hypothetical protein DFH27DRAFT_97632 [Peziza echinospora]
MTTPHRGLPLPPLPTTPQPSSIGPIPQHIWQGSDETVRTLLLLRTEEERHLSEIQKTKQDELRLETRRTEFNMLREALSSGMPAPLVALMFAGTSNLRGVGSELLQGYIADLNHQPQRVHQVPPPPTPELRRETRLIGQAHHSVSSHHQHAMPPPTAASTWDQPPQTGYQSYPSGSRGSGSRSSQSGQSQTPLPQGQSHRSSLPRINTSEMQMQKPGQVPPRDPMLNPSPMPHSAVQPPASAPEPPAVAPSSGIYFHHWQPPSSQTTSSSTAAQRSASPQRQLGSPFPTHTQAHLAGPEVSSSPKRRKTLSGAPYSPPYQSGPPPNMTPARRRAHSRQRSDTASSGGRGFDPYQRSRQRRSDGGHSQSDEHPGGPSIGDGIQGHGPVAPNEGGGSILQQGPGHEQGVPSQSQQHSQQQSHQQQPHQHQQQQHQQQQPPSRPYSAGPDRSRDLPYPGPPGSEGGQQPQGGNGRH